MRRSIFFLLAVWVAGFPPLPSATADSSLPPPLTFSSSKFELEDLTAEFYNEGKIVLVTGKIRNRSFAKARGHVIIYFRDKNDDVIFAMEEEVNKSNAFPHGKAGEFEVAVNVESVGGIENISVEFVER